MLTSLRSSSAILLLFLPACGGNVETTGASGTTSGAGGAHHTSSATAGTGGVTASSSASTTGSTSSSTGGPIPDCATFGAVGAGMTCSQEGAVCQEPYACCGVALTCKGGVWTASPPLCNMPCLPCGDGLECATDAVCVHDTSGGDYYQCMKNPCMGMPTCSCAMPACEVNFQNCKATQGYTITCG